MGEVAGLVTNSNSSAPKSEVTAAAASAGGRIKVALGKPLKGCSRTRSLIVEGAVGIKPDPLKEVETIQRALNQIRGVHPPPVFLSLMVSNIL